MAIIGGGSKQPTILFSTADTLANGATYDSGILSLIGFTQVSTSILSVGADGTILITWYEDAAGTNLLRTISIPYTDGSGFKSFSSLAFTPYVRYRFTADEAGQTQFWYETKATQTSLNGQILGMTDFITDGMVASLHRSVVTGKTDGGDYLNVPVTNEGHLEVALHAPILPFGAVEVGTLTPIFQQDGVYGVPTGDVITTSSNGEVKGLNNLLTVETSSGTIGSLASLQSRQRLRYRPGQGVVARYTALFTAGIANTVQVAGVGTGESGFYFGYNGTQFGILWSTGGVREIQTLTVSAGAGGTEAITLRVDGTEYNFNVSSGTATSVAWQISQQTYSGWKAEQRGSTVIFLADAVGNKTGSFSMTSNGTAAGTFAETKAGVAVSDTWIPQSTWNGDKLDGTGASGITLDPTKGNVYEIGIQYLGFGAVAFRVEVVNSGNNADFVTVHTIAFPNSRTTPSVTQPSFPFTMAVYNTGTASGGLSVSCGSYAGFLAGEKRHTGPRHSFIGTATSSTSTYVPLFTIRNDRTFGSRANQTVVNVLSASGAAKSNTGITTFYIIKGGTLSGTPSFGKHGDSSVLYVDTAATGVTFSNDNVVWSATVSETGQFTFAFTDDIQLQPGEYVTLAVRSVSQTAVCVGQINVREDQ